MIGREIPITFLESPDIVFSLVPDQDWYLKVDQISPTLMNNCMKQMQNGLSEVNVMEVNTSILLI